MRASAEVIAPGQTKGDFPVSNPFEDDEDEGLEEDEGLDAPQQSILPGLDISAVEIRARSVTWHEMRWRKKPMTLSRFRQMMAESLVDEERVKLRGEPWFFVNHDPDRPPKPDHRQFLVQFGKQLCRCPFRIRHIEGHPSDRERACEGDWPSPLHEMRSRHEWRCLYAFIDQAMQGGAALPEKFDRRNHPRLAFPHQPPFAAFSIEIDELAWWLEGAIDPGADLVIPPSPATPIVSAREKKRHNWLTPDPAKPDPPVITPRSTARLISAVEYQRESRDRLRQYLESRGIPPGQGGEHWESLIEQHAAAARDYIERWNALMDELLSVEQLII